VWCIDSEFGNSGAGDRCPGWRGWLSLHAMVTAVEPYSRRLVAGLRVLATAQLVIAGGYLAAVAMFGYSYLDADGDMAALLGGLHDPKDLVPGGMHLWNPLSYLYAVVAISVLVGWLLSAGLLLLSVPFLADSRMRVSRALWWSLFVGAIGVAVLLAVTFTPFGAGLGRWIAD
jgi:hypothetical protein